MISGRVNSRLEATLTLEVLGPNGQRQGITAVIDTGFNGDLSLPAAVVSVLALIPLVPQSVRLGDARRRILSFYEAELLWDGQLCPIRVLCVEGDPLVGTAVLNGYRLTADFVVGGPVNIEAVP